MFFTIHNLPHNCRSGFLRSSVTPFSKPLNQFDISMTINNYTRIIASCDKGWNDGCAFSVNI